jgi:hypothetical protein
MAFAYVVDPGRSLVLSRGFDTLTDADLLNHVRSVRANAAFRGDMCQLADFRDVVQIAISAAGIRELAALNPWGPGARRAVVVGSDYAYGMARMYQIIREPSEEELEIFRDLGEALDWLGFTNDLEAISAALSALH